jgi:hypothetical protein
MKQLNNDFAGNYAIGGKTLSRTNPIKQQSSL